MRIAHVITWVSEDGAFGGPVAVMRAQTAALAAAGHTVEVFAGWDGRGDLRIPGVTTHLFRARRVIPRSGFIGLHSARLARALSVRAREFDVVHIHLGRHLLDLRAALRLRGNTRIVLQTHGMVMPSSSPLVRLVDVLVTRRVLRSASTVLALTAQEQRGLERIEHRLQHVERLPNGVPRQASERQRPAGRSVLFLARLAPRKRVIAFAEAAAIVHAADPSVRFAVVGPDEGDLAPLQRSIDRLGLRETLIYEGVIAAGAGPERIARAAVYVLPARGEVFPMTVLEALSVGTPVIIDRDCAIAGELEEAGAAVVTDGSPDALASAIRVLLDDPAEAERLRGLGLEAIADRYSIEAVERGLERAYSASEAA